MTNGISIIIPTHKVPEYLKECIQSIQSQNVNFDVEIIVGIDNCEKTLKHIQENKEFYQKIKVFQFNESVGPYIIKNNLINESMFEYVLFFDSDDLMIDGMLKNFYENIESFDVVNFKFLNFEIVYDIKTIKGLETAFAILGIKKTLFNNLIGFENWICHADVEFSYRLKHNKIKSVLIEEPQFHRRIHTVNLTVDNETNLSSKLRSEYIKIFKKKKYLRKITNPIKEIKKYHKIN
jgi:glycosyltransferase involved in cell wall biosynthesis